MLRATDTPAHESAERREDLLEYEVGTLVHLDDTPIVPYTVRVVVGVSPDGMCLTAYVAPPPWLTEGIHPVDAERLAPIPLSVAEQLELLPIA